jgi:hypothetical protein
LSTERHGRLLPRGHIAVLDSDRIVQFGTWQSLTSEGQGCFAVLLHAGAPSR